MAKRVGYLRNFSRLLRLGVGLAEVTAEESGSVDGVNRRQFDLVFSLEDRSSGDYLRLIVPEVYSERAKHRFTAMVEFRFRDQSNEEARAFELWVGGKYVKVKDERLEPISRRSFLEISSKPATGEGFTHHLVVRAEDARADATS